MLVAYSLSLSTAANTSVLNLVVAAETSDATLIQVPVTNLEKGAVCETNWVNFKTYLVLFLVRDSRGAEYSQVNSYNAVADLDFACCSYLHPNISKERSLRTLSSHRREWRKLRERERERDERKGAI